MLREPGPNSLDLNLPTPSTERERRFAARGSRTWCNPDPHPTQRCPFYHPPMNFCTETLNFTRRTCLHPGPRAALGCSRVPHGHHPQWGQEAKQTPSPSASPRHVHTQERGSWPQGRYCLRRVREQEPGPGLRHTLVSCLNCVGVQRTGKAAGACCLVRSCTLLPAPHAPPCFSSLPALHLAVGWVAAAFSSPSILRLWLGVSVASHFQTLAGCWVNAGEARCFELIQ